MPFTHRKIIKIVSRSHFDTASPELRFYELITNDRDLPTDDR